VAERQPVASRLAGYDGARTMSYTKTIVCLANSRKPPSGRCVAGREVTASGFGDWIRPVSARPTQEISEEERRYENGGDPRVLDVVTITMARSQPHLHQQENHLIDADYYWEKQRTISWPELQDAIEDPAGPLWLNGPSSTYGRNDRVPEDRLSELTRSLYLIQPQNLELIVASEGGNFGPARRRVRARFDLCGCRYCIVVTDPLIERTCLAGDNGVTKVEDALICVSLGEVFHAFAYKLAAAVITPRPARR
jgi:hypothetical protein